MKDNHKVKTEEMRLHIEAHTKSNVTVEQYCRENGLARSCYYYWHKKLSVKNESAGFVPLTLHGQPEGEIKIAYPNGVQIIFSGSVPVADLKELACCI
ncbi:MAG: hypothetical protein M3Z56_09940 [Bacteroidota bacterium]|nr:hypothetical protein [Bacteroidota bacterium]